MTSSSLKSFHVGVQIFGASLKALERLFRGLSGYKCYALQQPDFIPVDASLDRACQGDTNYMEAITVASLAECKQRCRSNATCKGAPEDLGGHHLH